jgi:spore maturation protein CgeB
MEKDFTPGKDLVVFTNVEEMKEKIDYYLHNEEERSIIASQGHETNKKFSRLSWAKNILNTVKENEE